MASTDPPPQPDFISYLFSEKPTLDCHFIVGDKNLVEPERIGAVKIMLMAHSEVFRNQLEDSQLKEKDIAVKDIYPDTFKILLKFVYGYDTTGDLEFDVADNMFYVAEKYLMATLKNKLAVRLMTLLTPDNVCCLLNNPAISTHLALKSHITQILRHETDKVLASIAFPEMSLEGLLLILQQDALAAPEIEVWRAAMKWAKHKTGSEDGQKLRKKLAEATKYLRICSFTGDQFCQEVGTSGVLNCNELQLAVTSIGKKRKCEELTEFSNEVEPRKKLRSKPESVKCKRDYFYDGILPLACSGRSPNNFRKIFSFVIRTKKHPIELVSWNCLSWDGWRCNNKTVRVVCETKITELPQHKSCNVYTSMVSKDVTGGCSVELNLADDDCNVSLPPNKEYQISISYAGLVSQIIDLEYKYENEYMVFSVPGSEENNFLWRLCPVISFRYHIIKEED